MKRFFRMLRLCCQHTLDLLFPVDPPFCQRIPLQEDDTYELENIKLEQQRQAYRVDNFDTRIQAIKSNVIEIVENLQDQIHTIGGEFGHRHHQRDIQLRNVTKEVADLKRQCDAYRKDIANCMKLIKHQHSVMNSFKVTSINPSVN